MSLLLTVLAVAAAVGCAVPPSARPRLQVLSGQWRPRRTAADVGRRLPPGAGRLGASVLGGAGAAVFVDGAAAVPVAVALAVVAWVGVGRLEPAARRRRREALAASLPLGVDLLSACLSVGRPPSESLRVVAQAVDGPLRAELSGVAARLDLGVDPVQVWRQAAATESMAPLARVMARSLETGAPAADGLNRLADDLRRERRLVVEQAARSVGVRAAAPLGLCFLPAFVLVGIVPAVVSAFIGLELW
ncbi:MAG TPA: type II secretion system F family protein [Nocardioidaceae bacterium]|nr:type II secretion system F family protein [Nocardioidaceae bacterium]